MAKPDRRGEYLGETVVIDDTVWIWLGSDWEDAGIQRPERSGDVVPLDEDRA